MNKPNWQAELLALYQDLQQGLDVSPARILRLEGQLAQLLVTQKISWQPLQQTINQMHVDVFAYEVSALHWQWCLSDGVFRIPYAMYAAPVSRR